MERQVNKLLKSKLVLLFIALLPVTSFGQLQLNQSSQKYEVDYSNPKKFILGGVSVSGTKMLDPNAIILLTGLSIGEEIEIPGTKISKGVRNLWDQGLFSDIQVSYSKTEGNRIYIDFYVQEQPRLSRYSFKGMTKGEVDKIREDINLYKEKIVTKNMLVTTKYKVKDFFVDKGYLNTNVEIIQKNDTLFKNHIILVINVEKNKKVKIRNIEISGNKELSKRKIKRTLKETKERSSFRPFDGLDILMKDLGKAVIKQRGDTIPSILSGYLDNKLKLRVFKTSKYLESNFEEDKKMLIAKYKTLGYRDVRIKKDSLVNVDDKTIDIHLKIDEGNKYYFRNVTFLGNSKYSSQYLKNIVNIEKGDVYNPEVIQDRIYMNPAGLDLNSLYMDNGYLFFRPDPVEVNIENDSIDLEIRIYEGQQAKINKIIIAGNTKTNDHVIRREVRTKPGSLFSRADIIRTQRELSLLGYFDPEQMQINPLPNPDDGTVDIEYVVSERPSDQVELSGGWGGGFIVGTLGLSFSNFSLSNITNKKAWTPLPSGDGQRLSIRAQASGVNIQSYSLSFTEPWLGGKRPNALSFSTYYSIQRTTDRTRRLDIFGLSVGLGRRLAWPDDHFQLYQEVAFQNYNIQNWNAFENFNTGHANNIFYKLVLSRSSLDDLYFPKSGSKITLTSQLTPPYSLLNDKDYRAIKDTEKFKFIEYHKWKFTTAWYTQLPAKFVLYTKLGFGALARYNADYGNSPFERFYLGGDGLTGFSLDAREVVGLRGYDNNALTPSTGSTLISKYTAELRYPFSLNPSAMIYGLGFVEAGNSWNDHRKFNPFSVYRSGGVGVRVFLPMFGLLGLDWGYRFDDVPGKLGMQKSQIHFTIGANIGQL